MTDPILYRDLDLFRNGTARRSLSRHFRHRIYKLRFASSSETRIEQKHARVTFARARQNVGPCRYSLANRLPVLERWFSNGTFTAKDLYQSFVAVRSLRQAAGALRLESHVDLTGKGFKKAWNRRVQLCKVLYHVDPTSLYRDATPAKKTDERLKARDIRSALKLADTVHCKKTPDEDLVFRRAMHTHQQLLVNDPAATYSVKRGHLDVGSLDATMSTPATKRLKRSNMAIIDYDLEPLGADIEGDEDPVGDDVFFKVMLSSVGNKRAIPVAPGAGSRLTDKETTVSLHRPIQVSADYSEALIEARATTCQNSPAHVVGQMYGAIEEIKGALFSWKVTGFEWTLSGCGADDMSQRNLSFVLRGLIDVGAYPNKPDSLGYSACPDTATTLDRLLELGVVVRVADRWFFTQVGVSRLATAERLEHRRAVFEPRSDVSIMSSTPYELMLVMREEGWTWRLWTPPSARTKKSLPICAGYAPGQAKVWCSTIVPSVSYMRCLLMADDLLEKRFADRAARIVRA